MSLPLLAAIVLIGLFVAGFGQPAVLDGALIVLASLTWITVVQRMLHVRRQALP